jgi:tetratricopeptide (TPR) repeat protein
VSLAAYHNRTGDAKLALEYARRAVEINPKSDGGNFQMGKALDRQQQWPAAAEALNRAIDSNPKVSSYHYVLSGVYRHLGKTQESQQHMEIFRQLEKDAAAFEQKRRESQRAASVSGGPSPAKAPSPQLR